MKPMVPPTECHEVVLLRESAAEFGVSWDGPPIVRRVSADSDSLRISALLWGDHTPRVVFLHGRAQNAHTWDIVILALGLPALAIDLPGHGHSDWRPDRDYMPWTAAEDVLPVLRHWAPDAEVLVGVSLGGLTAVRLITLAPSLVRRAVIIEATPWGHLRASGRRRAQRRNPSRGPARYRTLEEMVDLASALAPRRPRSSLRRDVVHNARRRPDGGWEWRYDRLSGGPSDFSPLWEDVSAAPVPLTLICGGASTLVPSADADEFLARNPGASVRVIPGAGHSVQSDAPLALAEIIRAALD
jgi:pimeloyl-ACP methyl ester carboxylesterase